MRPHLRNIRYAPSVAGELALVAAPIALIAVSLGAVITLLIAGGWSSIAGYSQEELTRWITLAINTAKVLIAALAVALPIGVTLAILLVRTDMRLRLLGLFGLLIAAALPPHIIGAAWLNLIGPQRILHLAWIAGIAHGLAHLPFVVLAVAISLAIRGGELEEAAMTDGAGRTARLRHITLPLALPGIGIAALLVTLWVMTDYSITDLLLVRTFAEEVYTQFQLHQHEPAHAARAAWLPLVMVSPLLLWVLHRTRRRSTETTTYQPPPPLRLAAARNVVTIITLAFVAALVIAPIAILIKPLLSAHNLKSIFEQFDLELATSIETSLPAAMLAPLLALAPAWWLIRTARPRIAIAAYVIILLATPAPVLGVALIRMLNHRLLAVLYDSPAVLTLAYLARLTPIAILLMIPAIHRLPIETEWTARTDGCDTLALLRRIVLPTSCRDGLITALVILILSLGELPCSLLLTPPGSITITARFFSLIHYGLYPDAAALALLSVALVIMPVAVLTILLHRRRWLP